MDKLDKLLKQIQSNSDRCIALQDKLSDIPRPEIRSWKLSEIGELLQGQIDAAIVRYVGQH